jgi:hypothetical protein
LLLLLFCIPILAPLQVGGSLLFWSIADIDWVLIISCCEALLLSFDAVAALVSLVPGCCCCLLTEEDGALGVLLPFPLFSASEWSSSVQLLLLLDIESPSPNFPEEAYEL